MSRVLIIVKYREDSGGRCAYDGTPACFGGLYHSALFVVQMLRAAGVHAKLVQTCDNNQIDKEVFEFKPDTVIIEALWVVPEKFKVLAKLHPKVRWVVRCHSEIPFIAYEGVAVEWLKEYVKQKDVFVASNSLYSTRDFQSVVGKEHAGKVLYLPNYYPQGHFARKERDGWLDIGCFGALRPLKNQLIQGLAAIEFANQQDMPLRFHVNTRCEQLGQAVLKNLRALFHGHRSHKLVEHGWETREQFLETLSRTDIGMQVSFSETFDITAADTVTLGIPLVTSNEVTWASKFCKASQTNTASILSKLHLVTGTFSEYLRQDNLARLRVFCAESRTIWLEIV